MWVGQPLYKAPMTQYDADLFLKCHIDFGQLASRE